MARLRVRPSTVAGITVIALLDAWLIFPDLVAEGVDAAFAAWVAVLRLTAAWLGIQAWLLLVLMPVATVFAILVATDSQADWDDGDL